MSRIITARVERLLPRGEAILYAEEEAFMVANAVPGDRLVVRVGQKRRGVQRGAVQEVIAASANRITPDCVDAAYCGGCALQYLHPDQHHQLKSSWVKEAFHRFFTVSTDWQPIESRTTTIKPLRRRVRWWVGSDEVGRFLGYRMRNSHQIVRIAHCGVVLPEIESLRGKIQTHLPDEVVSVQVTSLADGIHLVLEADYEGGHGFAPPFAQHDGLSIQWWWRSRETAVPLNHPVTLLHDHLSAGERRIKLRVGPDDFLQGEVSVNDAMIRQIQSWAEALACRRVVDLFAGIGNLSLPLAAVFEHINVTGAELRPQSVSAANKTAHRLNLNAHYHVANLFSGFDTSPFTGADLMIVDPPRKGAKYICEQIQLLLPGAVILCSCDIASGVRDAAMLADAGYQLRALRAFDLFPYAGHVEAMSLWLQ